MRLLLFFFTLSLALLATSPVHAHDSAPFGLLQDMALCIPMQQEQRDAALCAVHAQEFHWFIANGDATWGGIALPGNPVSAHSLADISLSPEQKFLAIIEADEGHPTATVIDFELWRSQGIIKPVWRSAVYPGYIAISRWRGEMLVITSNHDLTRADRLHLSSENEYLLIDRDFLLDPQNGNIVSLDIAQPGRAN